MITDHKTFSSEEIDRIIYMYRNRPCTIAEIARDMDATVDAIMEVLSDNNVF